MHRTAECQPSQGNEWRTGAAPCIAQAIVYSVVWCSHGTILLLNWAVNMSSTSFYITLSDFYLMFLPWYKIVLIKSWLPRCDEECHWNTPAILRNTRPEHSHWQWGPMKLLQLRSLISHYGQEYRVLKSEYARWGSNIWLILIGQNKKYSRKCYQSKQELEKAWSVQLVRWPPASRPHLRWSN